MPEIIANDFYLLLVDWGFPEAKVKDAFKIIHHLYGQRDHHGIEVPEIFWLADHLGCSGKLPTCNCPAHILDRFRVQYSKAKNV